MEVLKQRIIKDGRGAEGGVLKVDSFLNHQMDIPLLNAIGEEFHRRFTGEQVTKILTIEASGIGIAVIAAQHFGNVPVVFAKKTKSRNLDGDLYTAQVQSFTRGTTYEIQVSKKFLGPQDKVLILDDFLAKGQALQGLLKIVEESGAKLVGCGIVIEKGFQEGGKNLREKGIRIESLAIISEITEGKVTFADEFGN
jgi:xanthine phosphoribosyltransferase